MTDLNKYGELVEKPHCPKSSKPKVEDFWLAICLFLLVPLGVLLGVLMTNGSPYVPPSNHKWLTFLNIPEKAAIPATLSFFEGTIIIVLLCTALAVGLIYYWRYKRNNRTNITIEELLLWFNTESLEGLFKEEDKLKFAIDFESSVTKNQFLMLKVYFTWLALDDNGPDLEPTEALEEALRMAISITRRQFKRLKTAYIYACKPDRIDYNAQVIGTLISHFTKERERILLKLPWQP